MLCIGIYVYVNTNLISRIGITPINLLTVRFDLVCELNLVSLLSIYAYTYC